MAHLGSYAPQGPPPTVLSGKQPHYYLSTAKPSKYNNNVSNNGNSNNYTHAPKTILQNTYRNAKSNGQSSNASTDTTVAATAATVVAGTEHALPTTLRIVGSCRNSNGENIVIASGEICELPSTETTDNIEELQTHAEDCNSSTEHIDATGTLPNEDSSATRNAKDKTPMCLVNELARYNKVSLKTKNNS